MRRKLANNAVIEQLEPGVVELTVTSKAQAITRFLFPTWADALAWYKTHYVTISLRKAEP